MRASLSCKSSNDVSGSDGLKDVMLMQRLDEFEHIGAHHFPAGPVGTADFVCDSCLVISPLHQFEDLGSDNIEAKHLAVMNVEENSPIHGLGSPDCVGYSEHYTSVSRGIDAIASDEGDCRIHPERIPETALVVRIGAASARKPL